MGAAVSKASEWADDMAAVESRRPEPFSLTLLAGRATIACAVDRGGAPSMVIESAGHSIHLPLMVDEALAMAKWLIDTFGSAPALSPEGNPGGGITSPKAPGEADSRAITSHQED